MFEIETFLSVNLFFLLISSISVKFPLYNVRNSTYISGTAYYNDALGSFQGIGKDALKIMDADTLTPMKARTRIYDIKVNIYRNGECNIEDPLVIMTGTVTN